MLVLKSCNKIDILYDEQRAVMGEEFSPANALIKFMQRIYMPVSWKCITNPEKENLYTELRGEFWDNIAEAEAEYYRLAEELKPQEVKVEVEKEIPPTPLEKLMIETVAKYSADEVVELIKPKIEHHIKETFGILPQVHKIETPTKVHEIKGVLHEKFDDVLKLVNLDIPVFLTGQAGTGKNVICKQVAEALDLDFYFTNSVTQEYQLKGFIDANGAYHETQFYKAFTEGGLFFLDEMDGSIPETLIILNSAIANRYFDFPIGKIEAHPDFRVVSAGNTVGTGADIEYTGRYQLDASSLDRFALIEVGYSHNIDEAMAQGDDELCEFAEEFRRATSRCGVRCLCTYRAIERIAKLKELFEELADVLKMALLKGLGQDDIRIVCREMDMDGNPYYDAMEQLI